MSSSDTILKRLLQLHPKIIDLSLERLWRLLAGLGHPERALPPVIHVAGTNGKGSTIAFMQAMLEAAGLGVHVYTSPHLVEFRERIVLAGNPSGAPVSDQDLSGLLEECEKANGDAPITFFEITTAAAFLAFARHKADYLLLETGLGGRLDATNVVEHPAVCTITPVDLDHQHYLGDTLAAIAGEKAGILKPGIPAVIAPQLDEAMEAIEQKAVASKAVLYTANQDWQVYEQHGRLVFQDEKGLLDLPLPAMTGHFQTGNAGAAIATLRHTGDARISEQAIAKGLKTARWAGRMQRLEGGRLNALVPPGTEIWLDGGHNPAAARVITQAMADLNDTVPRALTVIIGMLNSKDCAAFIGAFKGLAGDVITLAIPGEANALPARELANMALAEGLDSQIAESLEDAVALAGEGLEPGRILICGSLYLAGHVLAAQHAKDRSQITGTAKI